MFRPLLLLSLPLAIPGLTHPPVDLTHYFDENTLYWGKGTPFHFTKVDTKNGSADNWYAANEFETAEHGGTHLDAPYHFQRDGWHVGDIPLERFIGIAVHLNLRAKVENNPDYEVVADDFEQWEGEHGLMPEGSIVLLDFGWTNKYSEKTEYFGTKDVNNTASFHFPGLSGDGAKWLAETGKVYGVGTDTASIDYGQSKDFIAHRVLAKHNMFILEHLAFPFTELPLTNYQIVALPMKIRHGSGAPCRVVAIA